MKRILVTFFFLVMAFSFAGAQDLWLYSFNGALEVYANSSWKPAETFQRLNETDSLSFGKNSSATILDRKNDKIYAIQFIGKNRVGDLITEAGSRSKKQSEGVIAYLWNSLTGKNNSADSRSAAGVVYRDEDVNYALAYAIENNVSNLPVECTLIDRETGYSIGEMAVVGNSAVIRVSNHSAEDLFVNVIDIDAQGNISPCIPVTSPQIMTQLLIPSRSEVLLESFPIVFAEPRGEDKLILVASPEWFDIDAVVDAMKNHKGISKKVSAGVFKQRLIVR